MTPRVNKMLCWFAGEQKWSDLQIDYKNVDDSPMFTALKLGKEEVSEKGRHETWAL